MPTYEYQCEKCGKVFDYFQSMSASPLQTCPPEVCPDAGPVRRQIGAGSGLIFKGSGFYITDYKNKQGGGSGDSPSTSKSESSPAPAESKPAAAAAESKASEATPASPKPA